jgi:hypothetical protein
MRQALVIGLVLALGCGGKTGNYKLDYAGPIAIQLVNQTSRPIEQIYIHPLGNSNRGTSWMSLEPGATSTVKLKEGTYELVAKSAKRRIDARWVETPETTTQLELREDLASTPRKLVFHDAGETPAGLDQKGTLGVTFMISAPDKPKDDPNAAPTAEPATAPAPESATP